MDFRQLVFIDSKCVICGSSDSEENKRFYESAHDESKGITTRKRMCKNGCCGYDLVDSAGFIEIFKSRYSTPKKNFIKRFEAEINDKIDYWKEDDRYLMKILEGK